MCGRLFEGEACQLKAVSEDVECVKYDGTLSVVQNVGHTVQILYMLLYNVCTMYQVPCTVCCACATCAAYYGRGRLSLQQSSREV